MKQSIIITEVRSGIRTLIPIVNIAFVQDSDKGEKDTYIRLKTNADEKEKYFFVKETLDNIAAQIEGPLPAPILMDAEQALIYHQTFNGDN